VSGEQLLSTRLLHGDDVVRLRHRARRAAALLGLGEQDATRVATAVSEACRAALQQGPATVTLAVVTGPRAARLVVTVSCDDGRVPAELQAGRSARTAVERMVDQLRTGAGGVAMEKRLPGSPRLDGQRLEQAREQLLTDSPGELLAAVRSQNQDLVSVLSDLREREAQLERLNAELEQTNRGVVALYAELEQRAEEVRRAQRLVFEELEGALRPRPPAVPGVELDVRYLPAQANSPTGGDLYDWFLLPDGSLHVTVVDVAGHGVASTRDALSVTHAVRTLVLEGHRLGRVLERADRLLQAPGSDVVATVLLARLDPASGDLQLAGGGHPPALLVPAGAGADGREPCYLEAPGRPIGYPQAGSEETTAVRLRPGDTVLLYTDGLVEVRRDIVQGLAVLAREAGRARGRAVGPFLDAVLTGTAGDDPLSDDTLVLALRWRPPRPDAPPQASA
jgi:serine phosphatase RsbU (regulator of sigma subunit)/anti-sigma regulatory factor (Ser/Thr protein kinase)